MPACKARCLQETLPRARASRNAAWALPAPSSPPAEAPVSFATQEGVSELPAQLLHKVHFAISHFAISDPPRWQNPSARIKRAATGLLLTIPPPTSLGLHTQPTSKVRNRAREAPPHLAIPPLGNPLPLLPSALRQRVVRFDSPCWTYPSLKTRNHGHAARRVSPTGTAQHLTAMAGGGISTGAPSRAQLYNGGLNAYVIMVAILAGAGGLLFGSDM